MNAVEIEQAITELADQSFDPAEFPFSFLECFDNSPARAKKLRKGQTNKSDIGGVLQVNNIHIKIADQGKVSETLTELRESPATQNKRHRVKFILSTDGQTLEAEDLNSGETVACTYEEFPDKFGFFLPLAGITTVQQIRENTFDVRATSRLNKLYVTLLQENSDWGTEERRHDMNHFMARLIFCFFAEDTDIFNGDDLFTATITQMSARDSSNTHEVISEVFRAMDVKIEERASANLPRWADVFPYVNGELFSGSTEVPKFSRIAKKYLLHIGNLDWKQINPDIFGSMIQAVADEEERSALGMHYTSVPNILKVLNPLFLDDLRERLAEAGDNARKLLNLRKRMSNIRVFDPACGSGNFLVIAYKEMRSIEAEINERRGEKGQKTEIPLTNFRGIELRDFSAEIARLALIIAEYQADVVHIGQKEARQAFLPLDAQNWITCGNALRLDWLELCRPTGNSVKILSNDLFETPLNQVEIDFENEGGETYVCGNPPYVGDKNQTAEQKSDLASLSSGRTVSKAIDYVVGWIWKASEYIRYGGSFAFVTTNSICQGVQVPLVWPRVFENEQEIFFAHRSFYWSNNASHNANVICVIVGVRQNQSGARWLETTEHRKSVKSINAYLLEGPNIVVQKHGASISGLPEMVAGNIPRDKANFMLTTEQAAELKREHPKAQEIIRKISGSKEFINGLERYCLWIEDDQQELAASIPEVVTRLSKIREYRISGSERGKLGINTPYRFERTITAKSHQIIVPRVSSERREFLPVGIQSSDVIVSDAAQAIYDAPLHVLAIICSRLHYAWVSMTAGRMKSDFRYSTGVCYNSFPAPNLTQKQIHDLTAAAENILLAREAHFPSTVADLYDPDKMPSNLRAAHDHNDDVLERIYLGRRFKNDTERLEKLFELYSKMTTKVVA